MDSSLEKQLSELYISNLDIICEGIPERINAGRRGFLENFNLLSLPSAEDEKYRHSDMRKLFSGEWEHYFMPSTHIGQVADRLEIDGYTVDVVNGFCGDGEKLTHLENGVVYGSLRAAMGSMSDVVTKYYNSIADNDNEAVTTLNSLFMQDGAFVYVPDGVEAQEPFVLSYEYGSQEQAQMCFARALVVVERGAKADVIISHRSVGEAQFMIDFVNETIVETGGKLNITEISRIGSNSTIVGSNYLSQEGDSQTNTLNVWLEGGVSRANVVTNLKGESGNSNLYGLYFGTDKERVDIDMTINHLAPNCESYELVKGVVSGSAVGGFTGKIYVAPDAQRTNAFQQNKNLQLSESARIYAEPQLEIYADDVKCSHGATVGQLETEAIYYMRQRGLSEQDAKRLQLYGFVNDVVSRCATEQVCDEVAKLARDKISEL